MRTPIVLLPCDACTLYQLCAVTGARRYPCAIDVFLSAIAFMQFETPRPWRQIRLR